MKVTSHRAEYEISVGGTADMDNTTTRRYEDFDIDENVFYLDRENERIVSGETPAEQTAAAGSKFGTWKSDHECEGNWRLRWTPRSTAESLSK